MSVLVRKPNSEELQYYSAMMVRASSTTLGAPYLMTQLFGLDPFILEVPESEDDGSVPIFAVDAQSRVYIHLERARRAHIDFCAVGLIHEAQHIFRDHFGRFKNLPTRYNPAHLNRAQDNEINDDLAFVKFNNDGELINDPARKSLMKTHYPEINFRPCFPEAFGFKPYLTAEEYLHLFQDQEDAEDGDGDGGSGDKGSGSGKGRHRASSPSDADAKDGDGEGESSASGESKTCGGGSGTGSEPYEWELGAKSSDPDSLAHSGKSPEEIAIIRAKTATEIRDWVKTNGAGSVPAGMLLVADLILSAPKLSWKQLTRKAALRVLMKCRSGFSEIDRSKRNRRYANVTDIIYPGSKEFVPEIAMAVDTSGSMGKSRLSGALSEVSGVLKSLGVRSRNIELFTVDATTYEAQKISKVEDIVIHGGGGTDMMKCFDRFDQMNIDLGVIFTDGDCFWDTTKPRSRKYHVIVVIVNESAEYANPLRFPPGVTAVHVNPSEL